MCAFITSRPSLTADFWKDEAKVWSKDVDRFAEPSKSVLRPSTASFPPPTAISTRRKTLQSRPGPRQYRLLPQKKRGGTQRAQTERGQASRRHLDAESGSSEDIAMLYLAMLRAAGLTAYGVRSWTASGGSSISPTDFLSARYYTRDSEHRRQGNRSRSRRKMCPFGTVTWRHSNAGVIKQSEKGNRPSPWNTGLSRGNKFSTFRRHHPRRAGERHAG